MSDDASTLIATVSKNRREDVRVALTEFAGQPLIDLRHYAEMGGGYERRPTKKGVALNVRHLPALIEALQTAAAEALRRGLIQSPGDRPEPWWDR